VRFRGVVVPADSREHSDVETLIRGVIENIAPNLSEFRVSDRHLHAGELGFSRVRETDA